MVPGIVYSWSWTILLDELKMYQFFATLSNFFINDPRKPNLYYQPSINNDSHNQDLNTKSIKMKKKKMKKKVEKKERGK